jgi:predicted glycogen debranching enzyme
MKTKLPDRIRFGREICGDLPQAEQREWWLSNGLGGYAAGTVAGTLTRRYHGLLIAPVNPPLGRHLVFAKADATLVIGDTRIALSTNRWGDGSIAPDGYRHIESFRLEGRMPVWRYAIGDLQIEQRVWMEQGANTTYVAFQLLPESASRQEPITLELTLLVNARDHHSSARPWEFNPAIECDGRELRIQHPNWFLLYLKTRGGELQSQHDWYENFALVAEQQRGLADRDNHLCVGTASFALHAGEWVGLVASLNKHASVYLSEAMHRFHAHDAGQLRRSKVIATELLNAPEWIDQLVLAADSFVIARPLETVPDGESVIAGYPWFGDWGRDTMIALPGLTLATGRYDTARRVLLTFAKFVDQGMLPNVFPGAGERPEYNTADAALWYIEAWRAYFEATQDSATLIQVMPILRSIIDWHVKGTRYGIGLDSSDGLLRAGEPGVQVTWMDAKIGDWVVTPRIGKPVEINALWYNALMAMAGFAQQLQLSTAEYRALASKAQQGFQRFVNSENQGLFDVLDGPDGNDATIRPNQIFAVSLPASPLDSAAQANVVALCGRELLTSYGLRSLTTSHPDYRLFYAGGVWERDSAYHQGPVWAWLLGHFALSEFRIHGDVDRAQARLAPLRDHLFDAGLGTVSEIFDGGAPHVPRGAPAQAWSVGCALEAWWRLEKCRRAALSTSAEPAPVLAVGVA